MTRWLFSILVLLICVADSHATDLDTIGVTRLQAIDPTLVGTGITVAQPEALDSSTSPAFEDNPAAVGQPEALFTWISTNGTSTVFPNALGTESYHADAVAGNFFGPSTGVAPGVAHADNYEADYFYEFVITPLASIADRVVNQSFAFGSDPPQQTADTAYDNYIDTFTNVFSSAAGLPPTVGAPGTAYNCIAVGSYGVVGTPNSPVGPTLDNGRSKPDMVAPADEESFAIPYVAGAAAVLLQAGERGDGGSNNIAAATDLRTVKALLLNGALKPSNWSHTTNAPLDTNYGSGVLNLYYSYEQLAAHQQAFSKSTSELAGTAHPPVSNAGHIPSLLGWDFQTISNPALDDVVNHYCFSVSSNSTLTATLVWDRAFGATGINNLDLYLYNATNGALIALSVSTVDNVQQIYVPSLAAGQYDLQVLKLGTSSPSYTPSETYALAYQFFPITIAPLVAVPQGSNCVISWPSSPTAYILQQTASLTPPIAWNTVNVPAWITNTVVWATLPDTSGTSFYRLVQQP
jgi:hypothetical protein